MNLFELPCDKRDRLSKSINTTKKTIETLQINLKDCESNFSSDPKDSGFVQLLERP